MDGIDETRVTKWLIDNIDGVVPPFGFELIAGGRSNLTFLVADAEGRRLVLRRPPISHVLSSAHDMGREHRIISALADTPVPVPPALGYCEDDEVNGRPFYVMDFVDGHILRGAPQTEAVTDEASRQAAGEDLVNVLVALHNVDAEAVGLGGLGRKEAYLERQLNRWHTQFQQSQQQEKEAGVYRPVPLIDEVHDRLVEGVPPQHGAAIVHGDYRLDNTVISPEGRVRAVLDWELCTLGDPLADVGILMVYWADRPAAAGRQPLAATALPGFPTRAELAERYGALSGRDLSELPFYVAFAHWKLACIMEGVYVRYAAGAMGGDRSGLEGFAQSVEHRARVAMEALEGSSL